MSTGSTTRTGSAFSMFAAVASAVGPSELARMKSLIDHRRVHAGRVHGVDPDHVRRQLLASVRISPTTPCLAAT